MGTKKDVLCFLNELVFTENVDNDCLEKLDGVKKMMVRDSKEY